ncbi:MAG TPA: hypothetical protein VGI35_03035 [Steroidobacteraceae bacterium]
MIRYLLLPWRAAPLALVGTFTIALAFCVRARLVGIFPAILLVSWFFKYCFVLLDAAVAGDEEPPVLSVEMLNPFDEQRPLAQAILIAAGGALASWLGVRLGRPALVGSAALLLAVLPASVAVLGITGNPFRAAYPVALAALIRGMGRDYGWLLIATLLCGVGLYALAQTEVPLGLLIALGQLALLTVFALIGGAVHENRFALGVPTRTRAERRAERELREHADERSRMLDRSFAHARLGRVHDAWAEIERWTLAHCHDAPERRARTHEEYAALIDSSSRWDDPRIADRLVSDHLGHLLAKRETGRALDVLERRLASNPRFRPASSVHAIRLRELAALAGRRSLHRALGETGQDDAAAERSSNRD